MRMSKMSKMPLWTTIWRFLKKYKIELPYDPAILFLGMYLLKKIINLKRYMHPMFIAVLFTIAKIWKPPVFINRGMDKGDVEYVTQP